MKSLLPISLLVFTLTLSGCAWTKRDLPWGHHNATPSSDSSNAATNTPAKSKPTKPTTPPQQTIVTPDASLTAKVLSVNTVARFVVLNFPDGNMPKMDQHLFLYRGGLKAAEVKIVGPQQDMSIVADLVNGDAQVGDTVRDQ